MRTVMSRLWPGLLLIAIAIPSFAMKNRYEDFPQACDVVWKAAVTVGKSQQYRIVSISDEERILSLAAGGFISGERMISLAIAPAPERGCRVTVQSRFSGLAHSDAPYLLGRIRVQIVGDELGRETEAFAKFKNCVENSDSDAAKCEAKFRRRLAEAKANSTVQQSDSRNWWNISKPAAEEPQK
jgi:hypothetical protein